MPTSQLEKEQRLSLKNRIDAARRKHADLPRPKDPPVVKQARKVLNKWNNAYYRMEERLIRRVRKRADALRSMALFDDPYKVLKLVERFERTGK